MMMVGILTYVSCRKTDGQANPLSTNEKEVQFFNEHTNSSPVINAAREFVKAQNGKYHFVSNLVEKIGYPYWDKSLVFENIPPTASRTASDSANIVFIPFVQENANSVDAALCISIYPADTTFKIVTNWQYHDSASVGMSGKGQTLLLMSLDRSVFGHELFKIIDSTAFPMDTSRAAAYVRVNSDISAGPVAPHGKTQLVTSTYLTICNEVWVPNDGDLTGCAPGEPCNGYHLVNQCTTWVIYDVTDEEGGGTGTGGTSGGSGGSTGGGDGGWTPSNPCGQTTPTVRGATYDCGPGWVPVDGGNGPSTPGSVYPEFSPYISNNDPDMQWWDDQTTSFPSQPKPSWSQLYANFPKKSDGTEMCGEDVYNLVGGQVLANMPTSHNACAVRLSRALNYSGVVIPNMPGQTYKGADNKYYFLGTPQLFNFLKKTFGNASLTLNQSQGGANGQNFPALLSGHKGIYLMQPNYPAQFGAMGHASLYNLNSCIAHNCDGSASNGCFFNAKGGVNKIYIWELQ